MGDDLIRCLTSCADTNSSGTPVGNDSYDLECVFQCSQQHTTLVEHTAEKYTQILQIICVSFISLGLVGKVFNCIIFLRKPLRGTSTGSLLLLKTIFDFVPLLWTFIFDTKFFVQDVQINASKLLCLLSRSSDIFVSWSIGFVILACTIRLATIVHSRFLPQVTSRLVIVLILLMMFCGVLYNWHVFYYKNLDTTRLTQQNKTFTYCNILFGRHMGYFTFSGFQSTEEFLYNAPVVNFIVSSLIPFAIIAATNIVIIARVLKNPSPERLSKLNSDLNGNKQSSSLSSKGFNRSDSLRSSLKNKTAQLTKKDVSYETTITLTTSCVFLTTNSIASTYVYVKSSQRSDRSDATEDVKTSSVYLILRMLTLIDTVLEFYIYFLTGKKFRQEVYSVIREILQHTPLRHFFKFTCLTENNTVHRSQQQIHLNKDQQSQYLNLAQSTPTTMSIGSSSMELLHKQRFITTYWRDPDGQLDRMESTV